jgi:hypothetical protein
MLATLNVGMWSGMMTDHEVSEEVSENHRAGQDAGRYNKRLVSSKFLSHVGSKVNVARRSHRILTLPWDDNGTRILSATAYLHYTETMRLQEHAVKAAAQEFVKALPSYIDEARSRLGTMFNSEDYPNAGDLHEKFYIKVELNKIPEGGDFRANLSDEAVAAIAQDIEDRSNQRIETAMQDIYKRVQDVTAKMVERLKEYQPATDDEPRKGMFHDTLVYNISELADLIPSLNITADPKLDALAKQLKKDLVEHSPEILRTDAKARKQTADAAERILKKVRTFLA